MGQIPGSLFAVLSTLRETWEILLTSACQASTSSPNYSQMHALNAQYGAVSGAGPLIPVNSYVPHPLMANQNATPNVFTTPTPGFPVPFLPPPLLPGLVPGLQQKPIINRVPSNVSLSVNTARSISRINTTRSVVIDQDTGTGMESMQMVDNRRNYMYAAKMIYENLKSGDGLEKYVQAEEQQNRTISTATEYTFAPLMKAANDSFSGTQREVVNSIITSVNVATRKSPIFKHDVVSGYSRFIPPLNKDSITFTYPGVSGDIKVDLYEASKDFSQVTRPTQSAIREYTRHVLDQIQLDKNAAINVTVSKSTRGLKMLKEREFSKIADYFVSAFECIPEAPYHRVLELVKDTLHNRLARQRSMQKRGLLD